VVCGAGRLLTERKNKQSPRMRVSQRRGSDSVARECYLRNKLRAGALTLLAVLDVVGEAVVHHVEVGRLPPPAQEPRHAPLEAPLRGPLVDHVGQLGDLRLLRVQLRFDGREHQLRDLPRDITPSPQAGHKSEALPIRQY
jgi:hypothetical protein